MLWLCGAALRITILAAAPVTPLIRDELHLSATEVGLVVSLPVALFAIASMPSSLLVSRAGTRATLLTGLTLIALGGALRGLGTSAAALYGAIVVMGVGVAILQPVLAVAVRQWLPDRVGLGTAVYGNGLLVGETLPVMLMLPLVLPWTGGWRGAVALWSLPVALTAVLAFFVAPRNRTQTAATAQARQWWPDWRSGVIWKLGALFGSVNGTYFATNSYLSDYLRTVGHPELIAPALTALNLAQVPASLFLLAVASRLERRAWPYIASALCIPPALAGIAFGSAPVVIASAALLGFAGAVVLVLGLTLPPLLSAPSEVARTSAAMFTISYAGGMLVALVAGLAWDLSGVPAAAFATIALCAVVMIAATVALKRSRELR